jgi:FdhD protein
MGPNPIFSKISAFYSNQDSSPKKLMTDKTPSLHPGWRLSQSSIAQTLESVAEEKPLDIRVNGETYAITLCSPLSQRELALGLLYSDGRIDSASDVLSWAQGVEMGPDPVGTIHWVEVTLAKSVPAARRGALNSACGACGKTEWEAPTPPLANRRSQRQGLEMGFLETCFARMREGQSQFAQTGGCHAAAAFNRLGDMVALFEDVGRHNAVDKVIGSLVGRNILGSHSGADAEMPWLLCVSGRIAYEIVSKAYRAGFSALAAVGAPTTLAISHAEAFGITLLGFCRESRATAYTHFNGAMESHSKGI